MSSESLIRGILYVGVHSAQTLAALMDPFCADFSWDSRDRFLAFLGPETVLKRVILGNGMGASRLQDVSV